MVVVTVVADKGRMGGFLIDGFLTKPTESKTLLDALRAASIVPTPGRPILVVDDDPSALELLEASLHGLGHGLVCIADGAAALRRVQEDPPGAVIVDLQMPGIDAFDFIARLRELPQGMGVPILIWTTGDLTADERTRLRAAAETVVLKGQAGTAALIEELRPLLAARKEA